MEMLSHGTVVTKNLVTTSMLAHKCPIVVTMAHVINVVKIVGVNIVVRGGVAIGARGGGGGG